MNNKKLIGLILVCAVVVVSILIVPTYAMFYDEIKFSASISARSFDIDMTSSDNLKVKTKAGETFRYSFFTETEKGDCNFYFNIDTIVLENCDVSLLKRIGDPKEYQSIQPLSNGIYFDDVPYTKNENRLYVLEITPKTDDLDVVDIVAIFSSKKSKVEITDMELPKGAGVFKEYIGNVIIKNFINVETEYGYRITKIVILPREDLRDTIALVVRAVDPNDTSDPFVVIDSQTEFKFHIESSLVIKPLNTVDVVLTIYLSTHRFVNNLEYHIDYLNERQGKVVVLNNLIAENVNIVYPHFIKDSTVVLNNLQKKPYALAKLTATIEEVGNNGELIFASISPAPTHSNAFELVRRISILLPNLNKPTDLYFEINSKVVTPKYFQTKYNQLRPTIINK